MVRLWQIQNQRHFFLVHPMFNCIIEINNQSRLTGKVASTKHGCFQANRQTYYCRALFEISDHLDSVNPHLRGFAFRCINNFGLTNDNTQGVTGVVVNNTGSIQQTSSSQQCIPERQGVQIFIQSAINYNHRRMAFYLLLYRIFAMKSFVYCEGK